MANQENKKQYESALAIAYRSLDSSFQGARLSTFKGTIYNNNVEYDIFISSTNNPNKIKITVFDFIVENGFSFITRETDTKNIMNMCLSHISKCLNINDLKILDF